MLRTTTISLTLIASLFFSMNASACDTKSCETAYLAATKQYAENRIRKAKASEMERRAYSKNRERRAYALYVHLHFMLHGTDLSKTI